MGDGAGNRVRGISTGQEIIPSDKGLALFHDIMKGPRLTQIRLPWFAVLLNLVPVLNEEISKELAVFRGQLGRGVEIFITEGFKPREVIQSLFGQVGIIERPDAGVDLFSAHQLSAPLLPLAPPRCRYISCHEAGGFTVRLD
jgi:hypothetical protein